MAWSFLNGGGKGKCTHPATQKSSIRNNAPNFLCFYLHILNGSIFCDLQNMLHSESGVIKQENAKGGAGNR